MGKILMKAEGIENDLTNYLDTNLFVDGCNHFYTLLYPLGKSKLIEELPEKSIEFFRIDNMDTYKNAVEQRHALLYNLWSTHNSHYTICFGSSKWDEFENLLNQDKANRHEILEDKIYWHPQSNVYLVPFFINHQMTSYIIEVLADHIKGNK
ncbi:hypothetical protein ACFLU5_11895 [Bacteroidota bacterium]